jgi:hypothetical protein
MKRNVDERDDDLEITGPIDFDLTAATSEPISRGWHTFVIMSGSFKKSSEKHLPQMSLRVRVAEDTGDADAGRTLFWNLNLTGEGAPITRRFLDAMGLDPHIKPDSAEEYFSAIVGSAVDAFVTHRKWQGEIQANAAKWREATFGDEILEEDEEDE